MDCHTVQNLLIVDDDAEIRSLLKRFFVQHGYSVDLARDGETMWRSLGRNKPDLVILDLMLPGESGLDLCRRLQSQHPTPTIMVTAMSELSDRIVGLELGADDYVSKPFDARELLARVRAVLRRNLAVAGGQGPQVTFCGWRVDQTRRELRSSDGVMVPLSNGEFDLLTVFIENPQRVLTREQLLNLARGRGHEAFDRSIDVQVSRLRRKIERDSRNPALIQTVRNGGYMLACKVERG